MFLPLAPLAERLTVVVDCALADCGTTHVPIAAANTHTNRGRPLNPRHPGDDRFRIGCLPARLSYSAAPCILSINFRGWRSGRPLVLLLRPASIVGNRGHDREPRHADPNLAPERAVAHHQNKMPGEGQEDADAENLQRLLAALDEGIEYLPLQARPVLADETGDEKSQRHEMQEAIRREVGLVVRGEGVHQPGRKQRSEFWKAARQRHQESKNQIERGHPEQEWHADRIPDLADSRDRHPSTELEQHLPAEWGEVPDASRVAGQIPAEMPGCEIEQKG